MNIRSFRGSKMLIFGIPLALILTTIFLAAQIDHLDQNQKTFSTALTVDLLITIPFIYFLLIRKTTIPKFTVMPFFVAGLVIASIFIPLHYQGTLDAFKTWLLPVVELTVFTIIFLKIRKIRQHYKTTLHEAGGSNDFVAVLKQSTSQVLPPKIAAAMSTEIGLIYYCFLAWKKPVYTPNEFTYHKESGIQAILGVLLAVALIELFCVHLLIHNSYPVLSWILSGISAYGVIQILGLLKSIPRTPALLTQDNIVIRMGLFQETKIPLDKIESVELTMRDYPKEDKTYQRITLFDHNCIIHLKETEILHGLFGSQKEYQHLVLSIDDKKRFQEQLTVTPDTSDEI